MGEVLMGIRQVLVPCRDYSFIKSKYFCFYVLPGNNS